jgi:tetratricopeptide (TPR) repeat protein
LAYELSLAHYCVAKAFLEKGSWHEAEGSLFSALKYCRDPALQTDFKGNLFSIYLQQERLDIALKLCQQIVEEMPHCNDFSLSELRGFLLRLGGLSLLTSRFVDARIHLAHAIECIAATSGQYSEEALKIRLLMAESLFLGGHVYRAQGVLNQLLLVIDAKSSSSEYQFSYQIRKRLASMKLLAGSALRQTALNLKPSDSLEWPELTEDLVADKRIMSMVREVAADCSSLKQLRRKLQSLGNRQLNEAFDLYLGLTSDHEVEKRADKSELLLFLECAASCLLVLRPGHCMIEQLEEQALSLRLEMQSE